jgi:pimeloyl-ACP methyl ester carboxylesterase
MRLRDGLAGRLQNWGQIAFHPNPQLDLQFNRYCTSTSMIETLHGVAGRVANVDDWHREMLALADQAEAAGDSFAVQNLAEAAQFFLPPDADRSAYESRMQEAWRQSWAGASIEIGSVDYQGTALRVQRFPVQASKGTILMHGGFDGYYEQITTIAAALQDNGHEVLLFEGPGQGLALDSLPMTHEWERPVAAVLDAYNVESCTILGMSLGGYLALRAAAFEPRIARLVCWDVMYDALDAVFHNADLTALVRSSDDGLIRAAASLDQQAGADPNITFILRQGYRVMGATTTEDLLRKSSRFTTAGISDKVTQDALILAGQKDHYVPLEHLWKQLPLLVNARSVTARIFTGREHNAAPAHCNVGNHLMAMQVIVDWLDQCGEINAIQA